MAKLKNYTKRVRQWESVKGQLAAAKDDNARKDAKIKRNMSLKANLRDKNFEAYQRYLENKEDPWHESDYYAVVQEKKRGKNSEVYNRMMPIDQLQRREETLERLNKGFKGFKKK